MSRLQITKETKFS